MNFAGADYVEERDHDRLENQLKAILELMSSGGWFTCEEISQKTGLRNISSISAQVRNMRKLGYTVERRNRDHVVGFSEYRILQNGFEVDESGQYRFA